MTNALVTGGTGQLGTHLLIELLEQGRRVRALKRAKANLKMVRQVMEFYRPGKALFDQVHWVEGDILDVYALEEAMGSTHEVFHCAALVSFNPKDDRELIRTNVEGTANVVNTALTCGVDKLCHVSSTGAVGKKGMEDHVDETSPWYDHNSNSAYSISKHMAEREIWRGAEEGLKAMIVNPSVIVGPGDWHRSSGALFRKIWNGFRFYTDGVNGFVAAQDVAKAMVQLMDRKIFDERFLVSSANLSYQQFFSLVASALGRKEPNLKANQFMTGLAWRSEQLLTSITGKAPGFTRHNARSTHSKHYYANGKLRKALGFEFLPVQDAVECAARFFLKQATISEDCPS